MRPLGEYAVDLVFCVDKTSEHIVSNLGKFIEKFTNELVEEMSCCDKEVASLRIKIIAFGDLSIAAFDISGFFDYLKCEEKNSLLSFCQSINVEYLDGKGTVDALEALACAIDSKWTNGGSRRRHVVVVLNEHKCSRLGKNKSSINYPRNMPVDLHQLSSCWEGTKLALDNTYQPKAGRLLAFVPNTEPWSELQIWNRYWPVFDYSAEDFLNDIDIQINMLMRFDSFFC